jgi:hypothetical protein
MLLEAREDMPLPRPYLLAVFRDIPLAGLVSLLNSLAHLLTARPARWGEFLVVFPQALNHAPVTRLDVWAEFLDIRSAGSFIRHGEGSLHSQCARKDHR